MHITRCRCVTAGVLGVANCVTFGSTPGVFFLWARGRRWVLSGKCWRGEDGSPDFSRWSLWRRVFMMEKSRCYECDLMMGGKWQSWMVDEVSCANELKKMERRIGVDELNAWLNGRISSLWKIYEDLGMSFESAAFVGGCYVVMDGRQCCSNILDAKAQVCVSRAM